MESGNYNIPSNNRELQRGSIPPVGVAIITYQVITGNYSACVTICNAKPIITYQVITGNYSILQEVCWLFLL